MQQEVTTGKGIPLTELTHLDSQGHARMVDVTDKDLSVRRAVAQGIVRLRSETVALLRNNAVPKGDVLGVARVAGILAAKRTGELIPLCHPLPITHAAVDLQIVEEGVRITAEVAVTGKTGVEMEALTAVAVTALTVYDMVKAADREAVISDIRLEQKSGGKSGSYTRASEPDPSPAVA